MQYRTLGRTGIKVSPFALGAMMFGPIGNPTTTTPSRSSTAPSTPGVNFLGHRGLLLPRRVRGDRREGDRRPPRRRRSGHQVPPPMGQDPNMRGNSRRWIVRAVEDSLARLGTDHVDLYQVHRPARTPTSRRRCRRSPTSSARARSARSGRPASGQRDRRGPVGLRAPWAGTLPHEQPTYSLLNRGIENEVLLPVAQRYGMGTLVYSPLAGGMLTGRVRRGQARTSTGPRCSATSRRAPPRGRRAVRGARGRGRREAHATSRSRSPGAPRRGRRRSSAPAPASSSTTCWPRRTSRSTTPCWTGSTRSSRPVRTSACSTCSTDAAVTDAALRRRPARRPSAA